MGRHILKCQLCNENITRGKRLDCHHAFCHSCIQHYYVSNKMADITCPVKQCSEVTRLPTGIVSDLKDFNETEIRGLMKNLNLSGDENEASTSGSMSPLIAGVSPTVGSPRSVTPPPATPAKKRPPLQRWMSEQPREKPRLPRMESTLNEKQKEALRRKWRTMAQRSISEPSQPTPQQSTSSSTSQRKPFVRQQSLLDDNQREVLKRKWQKAGAAVIQQGRLSTSAPSSQPSIEQSNSTSPVIPRRLLRQDSTLDEKQKESLRKRWHTLVDQVQLQAKLEDKSKPQGFTTRKSKPKKEPEVKRGGSLVGGGFGSFLLAGKQTEWEFRNRREGPWGYQDHDEWGAKHWGVSY